MMTQRAPLSHRLAMAWKMMRGQPMRDSRPIQYKKAPMAWPAWRDGKPEWQIVDLQSYVNEGFNLNSLIYSAIMYKARAARAAPLRAYTGNMDKPTPVPPNDPLALLLARPNQYQSGPEFHSLAQVYLNLAGNCYVYLDKTRGKGVTAMYLLRPDRMFIVPEGNGIKGYLYAPEGKSALNGAIPFLPESVIHIKLPNPGDPLEGLGYGLSPISPLAKSADVDNRVTEFLNDFFKRGAMVNVALKFKMPLDDIQIARIRERWHEVYGGSNNWTEVGIFDEDGEAQRLGMDFEEMGFETIDERNESRILGPFGVPPILIGTRTGLMRSTYSNYEEARKAFWEDTFVPELNLMEAEYQHALNRTDIFVQFDYSEVPALQANIGEQVDAASKLWAMGVPVNQALDAVGLPIGQVPGGDVGYLPMNLVPVLGGLPAPLPGAGEPDDSALLAADGTPLADQIGTRNDPKPPPPVMKKELDDAQTAPARQRRVRRAKAAYGAPDGQDGS